MDSARQRNDSHEGTASAEDPLAKYRSKRDFDATPEPDEPSPKTKSKSKSKANAKSRTKPLEFVVQKHWASRLHYDFRIEIEGTMKSWAVPKGPSMNPADKRLAVQVEDHPMSYNRFEGQIPKGHYGAGKVVIWDKGTWEPAGESAANPGKSWREGKLKFALHGDKLNGHFTLVRMHGKPGDEEKQPPWLLMKEKHEPASTEADAPAPDQSLAAAPRAKLPATFAPQLATLVEHAPAHSEDWLFELKFDGYRLLARVDNGKVKLFTRNGHDWTHKLQRLAESVKALEMKSGWLDGELIVPGPNGAPDFQALQNAFEGAHTDKVVYYLFDMPFLDGRDLRALPLVERREALRAIAATAQGDQIRFSESFDAAPDSLVTSACKIGFEGVIGKLKAGTYVSRRSSDWIKLKCSHRQEFVIGGYTDPKGSRTGLGSLLLGVHDKSGKLQYAGNVGTGFSDETLRTLLKQLKPLETTKSPFAGEVQRPAGVKNVHWLKPQLLAEVSFAEWTRSNHVRHSVFHGLRTDKPAKAIAKEKPVTKTVSKKAVPSSLRVTHPERVIDTESGVRKIEVIEHYAAVGKLMMDELKGRPVSVVRAPQGVGHPMFFQKHEEGRNLPGLKSLDPALDPAHAPLLEVEGPTGLMEAAQMNVIEFHAWNARKDKLGRPDRITFDLDPGEGVGWPQIQEAAQVMKVLMDELGLVAFLKTSGGKGLHVVVPIKRTHDWETAKDFSHAVVQYLARMFPQRFVAKSGPKNRVKKIFIDYLRNGYGATTAAAWSARARPGMGVSVPVEWSELDMLDGGAHWTVQTVRERLAVGNAPWKLWSKSAKSLTDAAKAIQAADV